MVRRLPDLQRVTKAIGPAGTIEAMDRWPLLRYLAVPANLTVLILVIGIGTGLTFAQYAGWYGLPLVLTLMSWLFNYAFVLLEAMAHGAGEPPVLAIEMINPFNEYRPLCLLALLTLSSAALGLVATLIDARLAAVLTLLSLLALPASIGALTVGNSLWQCVDPTVLWHIVRTLGATYVGILVAIIVFAGSEQWLLRSGAVPLWVVVTLGVFEWLSVFALIGGALFEHRERLGHEAVHAPERRTARLQSETERERSRFMDRVHGQARGGNLAGAWHTIHGELTARAHTFDTYDWLLEALSNRDDQRLAARLGQEYIGRALGRDNARATLIAQRCLQADPQFRPRSAAQCLRMAELLQLSGDRRGAQRLLQDFEQHFPNDPAAASAQALAASLRRDAL